jgi:hypothetical protein
MKALVKMLQPLWISVTLAILLCSATGFTQQNPEQVQLFEALDAIEDADPEQRHPEVLLMPTRLLLESSDIGTLVGFDSISVHSIKISVGHKMVVGCKWVLYYYDGAEQIELRHNLGGSLGTLFGSGRMVIQGLNAIAQSKGSLQLIADLTVFETDIPIQHMWDPKQGRYRALWRGLATGVLMGNMY